MHLSFTNAPNATSIVPKVIDTVIFLLNIE